MDFDTKNESQKDFRYLLAIETSCDETAAAVLEEGKRLLSNVVASQVEIHSEYGGIVPELASRHHLESIVPVVDEAIKKAGIEPSQLEGVVVTQGPGLVGSLLVGLSFAKAFAEARSLSITGVNHIHAHLFSVFLGDEHPEFPFLGLVVSGGHTSLYAVNNFFSVELLGNTRDDAAGEAFDKVAKILGLPYPGGPVISKLAQKGNPEAYALPRARLPETPLDFSFSGLKTAVLTLVNRLRKELPDLPLEDICASFQEAVVDVLVEKSIRAAKDKGLDKIVVGGGVAANDRLRAKMVSASNKEGITVYFPPLDFCMDNAAMVALVGYRQLQAGMVLGPDADVYSRLFQPN